MAFNKMFVMLPVMLAARKLDGEDPNIVFMIRCAYGGVQAIVVLLVAYIFIQASSASGGKGSERIIYVPPPPQPFADPNAKKQYQEKQFGAHVFATARALLGSTLFGICLTVVLHLWKGMIVGLAIQTIMGPLNLVENAVAKAVLLGGGFQAAADKKIFDEKTYEELTEEDEIIDENNQVITRKKPAVAPAAKEKKETKKSFEDVLLDTWDEGADADIGPLMDALNKKNINHRTSENGWTPVMLMSGLGVKKTMGAMRQMKALGADPAIADEEGWNALHWAAFHGSPDAAKILLSDSDFGAVKLGLHEVKDKEGKTPIEHARAEGNTTIATMIEEAILDGETPAAQDDGLRKRK